MSTKISEKFLSRAKEIYQLKELERLGLTPDLVQREKILKYIALILKWNMVAGLISKKDEENLFIRHFCDSLQPLLLFGFKKNATILDIGSGGGFPAIPTQIFRPDLSIVLAESNRKKAAFLGEVKRLLEFEKLEVCAMRVEKMPSKAFDYVVSRGQSSLQDFARTSKRFVLPGEGRMYTFKGKEFHEELEAVTNNKDIERVRICEIAEYDLGNQIFGLKLVSLEVTP